MKIQLPDVNSDEVYLCGLIVPSGVQHTILVPGDAEPDSWDHQMEWAKGLGADLPTRAELVVAYEQHREQFQAAAYWSNTQDDDPEYSGWAWYQDFLIGHQSRYGKRGRLRARAVRRLTI